ncbi:MAG: hypothetical protein ACLTZF_08560 [Oscillospiraceae bacterium]
MTKQKFLMQGILLTAFSLFLRVTNIGYRSYLSAKIGAEGMGLYQLISPCSCWPSRSPPPASASPSRAW